jgi:REP element-mobilizing transposase RayT
VTERPNAHRSGPPHNPGVRELVSGKQKWTDDSLKRENAMRGFRGWHERGFLPHRDEPGLTQFITFHLADSFPASLRSEWAALQDIEESDERRVQLQEYLDRGKGECHLQRHEIAALVEEALRFHHAIWYDLRAWVIMPNHIHFLIKISDTPLSKIIKELKRYTARESNKMLRRTGEFWAEDFYDTYMRDTGHEAKTYCYIENNPVKALLVREPKEWLWSSARFRDAFGKLSF